MSDSTSPPPYETLVLLLREKFEVDPQLIDEQATFRGLDLDSIAVVEVFVTLSEHWQVPLDDSAATPDLTLADTAAMVGAALDGRA